jgi:hypothetical protein
MGVKAALYSGGSEVTVVPVMNTTGSFAVVALQILPFMV